MPVLPEVQRRQTPTVQRGVQRPDYTREIRAQGSSPLGDIGEAMVDKANDRFKEEKINAERDKAHDVYNRENQAMLKANELLYGENGLYNRKGGQAVNLDKDFETQFKSIYESAFEGISDDLSRQRLEQSLNNFKTSQDAQLKKYSNNERTSYADSLMDSRANILKNNVVLNYADDDIFNQNLSQIESTAISKAKAKGFIPGDVTFNEYVQKEKSSLYETRMKTMMASDDMAVKARGYKLYEQTLNEGKLHTDTVIELQSYAKQLKPEIDAYDAFTGLDINADLPVDNIFNSMLVAESNNSHLDKDGKITTSPAGAKGIAQLMEPTAREQAKLMGIDPDTWKDEAVNEKLGRAYFDKMLTQFNDPTLAVMAYNAGPGAVSDFMNGTNNTGKNSSGKKIGDPRKGEVSINQFIESFPYDETKNYVKKVMGGSAVGVQGLKIDMAQAEQKSTTLSEESKKSFMSMVERHNAKIDFETQQQKKSAMNEAMSVLQSNQLYSRNSAGEFDISVLPVETRVKLERSGIYDEFQSYTGQTDTYMADYLYSLDGKTLKEVDLDDPSIRLKLSPQDYSIWKTKQEAMASNKNIVPQKNRNALVKEAFQINGVKIDPKKVKDVEKRNRFNQLLDTEIQMYAEENDGKFPNQAEMQRMIDNLFIEQSYDVNGKGIWTDMSTWGGEFDAMPFEMTTEKIPDNDRKIIEGILKKKGYPVTEPMIIRWYTEYYQNTDEAIED